MTQVERNARLCAVNRAAALLEPHNTGKEPPMTLIEYCAQNARDREANRDAFRTIFRVPLAKYWSNLTRFDVVKFDEEVVKSGDGSCGQAVIDRWGQEAYELIKRLL